MVQKVLLSSARSLFYGCSFVVAMAAVAWGTQNWTVSSPNSAVTIEAKQEIIATIAANQRNCYFRVLLEGTALLDWSPLGLTTSDLNFVTNLTFVKDSQATIDETYTLPSGKRSVYHNRCNELTLVFSNPASNNRQFAVVLRAYDDAVAFRYELRGTGSAQITGEVSGFALPSGSSGWGFSPGTGDEKTYDQFSVGAAAVTRGIPVLFRSGSNGWLLITEAAVFGDYTGSWFASKAVTKNVYQTTFPSGQGAITGTLPWKLPWRVAIVGRTLRSIVESSVVEHLNPPCELTDVSWIKSGRCAWSWLSQETGDMNQQKRYIDFANLMGWEYNLTDWNFPKTQVGELCQYGASKSVGNELWYNYSEVKTQAQQQSIFSQCRTWGLKSLKIDFIFDNNDEKTNCNNNLMKWFEMTAKNLAANKLMATYHGCTVPRGERRRWPHLMAWEAVLGYEWIGRGYPGPKHNCMLPYTRNVIGPMDHTPVLFTLGQLTNGSGSTRNTTDAHETALSVIYESGIQHFADRPEGYNGSIAKPFLQAVPSAWDDIRFIDGIPGESVILARRKGNDWYVAGISATPARTMNVSLDFLKAGSYTVDLYKDSTGGTKYTMAKQTITITPSAPLSVWVKENGGFCCRIPDSYSAVSVERADHEGMVRPKQRGGTDRLSLYRSLRGGPAGRGTAMGGVVSMSGKTLHVRDAKRLPQGVFIAKK